MSDYEKMTPPQSIRALSVRVEHVQRELAGLRLDVRRLIFLLEHRASLSDTRHPEDADSVPGARFQPADGST